MFGKTPVSALEEYCAKKNLPKPVYEIIDSAEENSKIFICVVEALGEMAEGSGRSKKEAKHDAATAMLKKMKFSHPDIQEIPQTEHDSIPTYDAVADLRDLCLQRDHPFPSFEIIQQDGPPEAPEFVVECRVATIRRFAKASTKKGARQLAAKKIVDIIRAIPVDNDEKEVATLAKATEEQQEKDHKKIQTYREYVDSGQKQPPGTLLSDRHNYFKNYDTELRQKAKKILATDYLSNKEKVDDLLKALDIKYKTSEISGKESSLTFIELKCEFDVVFADSRDNIFSEIINYFKDMID